MGNNDFIDDCESLMAKANEHIDAENFKAALKIGKQLEKLKFTGAFETQALAYSAMGKKKKAIKILEEGIKIAPDIWLLWQLLGNYYSDIGKFDQSQKSYENGLKTKNPDKVSLLYNYANMLERWEKFDAANIYLTQLFESENFGNADKELATLCFSLRIGLYNKLKKYDLAREAFKACLQHPSYSDEYSEGVSRVLSAYATTLFETQQNNEAEETVLCSLRHDRHNKDAQYLLREIRAHSDDYANAKYMRIMVHGKWFEPDVGEKMPQGFFTTYDVVADDEDEAAKFIKEIEPKKIRDSIKIEEVKILKSHKQPKGIYKTTGYCFYSDEEK